jgi:hypothetical protein
MPDGFTEDVHRYDGVVIHHRHTGMGCMNVFCAVWLAIWTIGCVFLLRAYLTGAPSDDGSTIPLWLVVVFWGFELIAGTIIVRLLFGKETFHLRDEALVIEQTVLGCRSSKTVVRRSIRELVQVKDGGEDEDSFPSWGLKLKGDTDVSLITRQPYPKSRWLGRRIARWAEVTFVEAPPP